MSITLYQTMIRFMKMMLSDMYSIICLMRNCYFQ